MKVAILGCGRMGQRHIQIAQNLKLDVVGICDLNYENLKQAAELYGLKNNQLFQNADQLFESTTPECVIIATTAPTHHSLTTQSAESGVKYILCEKPMSISIDTCNSMIETCNKHKLHLAINHQMRFMEQYQIVKEMIKSGEIGDLNSITVKAGNFGLAMNGTHYFEMFRYITDEEPGHVTAWFSSEDISSPRGAQFKDKAGTILLESKGHKKLYLDATQQNGHGVWVIYTGSYGQIFVDELSGQLYINKRQKEYHSSPTTRYGEPSLQEWKNIQPADILDSTQKVLESLLNKQNYPDGYIGKMTVETLVAAYASNENNHKRVKISANEIDDRSIFPWA